MNARYLFVIGALVGGCTVMVNGRPRRIGGSDPAVASVPVPPAARPHAPHPTVRTSPASPAAPVVAGRCQWFPVLLMMQHEGGGKYGPLIHSQDLNLRLDPLIYYAALAEFAKQTSLKQEGFECDKVHDVASDDDVLRAIRKQKHEPEKWLAAHWMAGRDWEVDTEYGSPVSKSRIAIVYFEN